MEESIDEVVIRIVARHVGKVSTEVRPEHRLYGDLALRPLDLVIIGLYVEDHLDLALPFERLDCVQTIDGLAVFVREIERAARCRTDSGAPTCAALAG
jgi:acyl carrier protein